LADNDNGKSGSGRMSPQASCVLTVRTGVGGRSGRGRIYLGGVSTDFVDGGREFFSDPGNDLQSAVDGLLSELDGSSLTAAQLGIWSRKNSILEFPVAGITPQLRYIGTQRRRAERFE
jgi:hypothetical protein